MAYLTNSIGNINEIEVLKDSLDMIIPYVKSIAHNSAPAPFTYINIVITVIAAIAGIIGAYYGCLGYKYSKKTSESVLRRSGEIHQRLASLLLVDAFAYLVRLLVWHYVQDKNVKEYISKEYLSEMKFHSLEETFQLDSFNNNADHYVLIYEVKGRLHAYNVAIHNLHQSFENNGVIDAEKYRDVIKKLIRIISVIQKVMKDVLGFEGDYINIINKSHQKYLSYTEEIQKRITDEEKKEFRDFIDKIFSDFWCSGVHSQIINDVKEMICIDALIEYKIQMARKKY